MRGQEARDKTVKSFISFSYAFLSAHSSKQMPSDKIKIPNLKEMVDKLVKDTAVKQGITEELKAKDQMAWVGAMNNIRHSAEEIVLREFVCSMEVL